MTFELQMKLQKDVKMRNYLRENSYWYKYLNRNPSNYDKFVNAMKDKYKIRVADKMTDVIDNIDMVSNILNVLK